MKELADRLRNGHDWTGVEAADLIEQQAAKIAELIENGDRLTTVADSYKARIAELEGESYTQRCKVDALQTLAEDRLANLVADKKVYLDLKAKFDALVKHIAGEQAK